MYFSSISSCDSSTGSGSTQGESFYLHNPGEVIYNRVKDLFETSTGKQQLQRNQQQAQIQQTNANNLSALTGTYYTHYVYTPFGKQTVIHINNRIIN